MIVECSIPGCDRPYCARGWCSLHWERWRRTGDPLKVTVRPAGMSKEDVAYYHLSRAAWAGHCLVTAAARNTQGYPHVTVQRRPYLLHRLVLEVKLGRVLRSTEQALHTCGRVTCINPKHLRVGTAAENAQRRERAGRSRPQRGSARYNAKLDAAAVRAIRRRYAAGGVSQRALAAEYGIHKANVGHIIARRTWQHVA